MPKMHGDELEIDEPFVRRLRRSSRDWESSPRQLTPADDVVDRLSGTQHPHR
jgi:hypothetical protein